MGLFATIAPFRPFPAFAAASMISVPTGTLISAHIPCQAVQDKVKAALCVIAVWLVTFAGLHAPKAVCFDPES